MDMLEGNATNESTVPTAPVAPPPPPKQPASGVNVWRLLSVGLIAFLLATFTGRLQLPGVVSGVRDAVARAPSGVASSASANDPAAVAAVKDVIQQANDAQAKAFAQHDVSLMRASATDSYYQELLQIDSDLATSGVTAIELTKLDFGAVTVSGATAQATTFETWRSTYDDGSVDERTDRNFYTLVQQNGIWKIQSDVQPDAQTISPSTGTGTPGVVPGNPASSSSSSSNWSGYAASGGTFTSVTGTWTVPQVSSASAGADATWVGIGGMSSRDLIQAGTQATVTTNGGVRYEAWIEMLPQTSRTVALSVSAGDSVTVSITAKSGNDWAIALKNNTTGETYDQTVQYASSLSSAEWVQEAPSAGRGIVPLDNFGTLAVSKASAVRDGKTMNLAQLGAKPVSMINGRGEVLAQPSSLSSDGNGFTVTRTQAQSTTRGTNLYRGRGGP